MFEDADRNDEKRPLSEIKLDDQEFSLISNLSKRKNRVLTFNNQFQHYFKSYQTLYREWLIDVYPIGDELPKQLMCRIAPYGESYVHYKTLSNREENEQNENELTQYKKNKRNEFIRWIITTIIATLALLRSIFLA